MIKQYNIYLDRETSFFSSKQCFDKSWGLWQIILRLRFLCGLSHMHGLNPYTFFSRASAATQPFENSVFQHTGYVPTRTTSMPWRKQFPTTRAKVHFTKQWGYAVGCCWFWTHRRHHIADEGCYSFGWRLLQTWQSQPAIRREFCGAERLAQLVWGRWARFLLLDDEALPWHGTLRALDGCSSSGRLPQLPLCLGWAHLSLATTGSLLCVMGEGPSPNWVQMVLDHPLMYPRLEERQLLLWRKYGLASMWSPHRSLRLAGDSWGSILLPRFLSSTHAGSCIVQDCELCLKLPSRSGGGPQRLWRPKAASSHSPRWAQAVAALQMPNNNNRRHHLRGFGVALRNRLQPGAQFVSLSILSCEFFDCEILRTSQKISGLNLQMLWLNVTWGGGTGHQLFATWCCCHRSLPCCPCHHWWLSRCWDPGSPHLGFALQVTPWAILSNGFASESLSLDIAAAQASKEEDKTRILNSVRCPRARTWALDTPFPTQHPRYDAVNRALASHFALTSIQQSYRNGQAQAPSSLWQALRSDAERKNIQVSLTGCHSFRDPDLRILMDNLPSKLQSLRLDLAYTGLEAFGWSSGCFRCFLRKRPSNPSDSLRRIFKEAFLACLLCFALPWDVWSCGCQTFQT